MVGGYRSVSLPSFFSSGPFSAFAVIRALCGEPFDSSVTRVLRRRVRWRSLAVGGIYWRRWIRTRMHHGIVWRHAWILRGHGVARMGIVCWSQGFPVGIIHGLHRITGHGDVLGLVRCPASLLPSLVKVTAGAHEAADHCSDDSHEQKDGRGNTGQSGGAELKEHAALLFALRDHLEGVQAAVAAVAVAAAEGDQGAVETIVPRAVLIHVPQAVFVSTRRRAAQEDGEQRQRRRDEGHVARRKRHPGARHDPKGQKKGGNSSRKKGGIAEVTSL